MSKIINKFGQIADSYSVIFCDLWGCIHNGEKSFPKGLEALNAFRAHGGYVILLTNAPRPKKEVIKFITKLGITARFYDDVITSGDATQFCLEAGEFGHKIYHIGPARDLCFFDFKDRANNRTPVELVQLEEASSIVCTGLFNDKTEEPSDYEEIIKLGIKNNLPLLCANPDIQVDYGHQRLWCAGAIAASYSKAGGKSIYFGKPHKPIYDLAITKLQKVNPSIIKSKIICVGDGILTDILGGASYGLDTLFVAGGLSSKDTGVTQKTNSPNERKLIQFLKKANLKPTASIGYFQ